MKEKKLGRGFKVGDKVKLTKAGEESGAFASGFREGDVAEVLLLNSFDDFISSVRVITGKAVGYLQYCDANTDTRAWFEHVDAKKEYKKKRKHFRMGDLVVLKENLGSVFASRWGDLPKNTVAVVYGADLDGAVKVEFINHLEDKNFEYCSDYIKPEALRLATKEERKALRKHKVAKITYDNPCDNVSEQIVEEEAEIPPKYNVKIGDYVKITENADGHPVGTVGFVTEIEEVPEGYYNHVVVSDFDDNCWNEHNVKLVHRATLTCEDEDNSEPNSAVTPATEEEKVVMLGDNLINRYSKLVYKVVLIDDIFESELPYHITSKNESMWISDGTVVQDYAKLLENGRVYVWATDTTFANVESWIDSTK